jgi:hypothetical protein
MEASWLDDRLKAVEERIRSLDFFGWALENTPQRDQFWETYRLLADALFNLRDALASVGDVPQHDRNAQSKAAQHIKSAVDHLLRIVRDEILRQHRNENERRLAWLDHFASDHDSGRSFEEQWERLFGAYGSVFEQLRLAHVACPTGEMDQ